MTLSHLRSLHLLLLICFFRVHVLHAETLPSSEQLEFFESNIRPVLVDRCYGCHESAGTSEGALILDHREALRRGGQSGQLLDFKNPAQSLLMKVLRHELDGLEMPQGEEKLSEAIIADFEKWIAMGAPDPREKPAAVGSQTTNVWQSEFAERKKWWSFQPLQPVKVPEVHNGQWPESVIDHFVLSKLEEANLQPAKQASHRELLRRLSYVLTGLPPTPQEIKQYLNNQSETAYSEEVDRLLASPAFGEHWARHWMDLVRYTETHGSEGDPRIPHAWKYRDYLIRAFNEDVPYDQLVLEHVAGDLLQEPRINRELHQNESALATAHWRMCFHGFAPTDAHDEKVRFTDDQINVFSKTFLGLTLSCARCHNHKFDPITQADYYALFGIAGSTRPGILDLNPPEIQNRHQDRLAEIKSQVRKLIGEQWQDQTDEMLPRILELASSTAVDEQQQPTHFLHPFHLLKTNGQFQSERLVRRSPANEQKSILKRWDFTQPKDVAEWFTHGNGSANRSVSAGEFTIPATGKVFGNLLPGGVYSHLLSTKHRNIFASPKILLNGEYELWIRVAGDSQALLRYVVHDYPRNGTVYPATTLSNGQWKWQKYDLSYWDHEEIHVELTTAADSPVLAKEIERSWFGIREVVIAQKGTFRPAAEPAPYLAAFGPEFTFSTNSQEELAKKYVSGIRSVLLHWENDAASDLDIQLIESARHHSLLNQPAKSEGLLNLFKEYQALEAEIAVPNRVAGLLETVARDQPLFIRGNHRQPAAEVPRRFLEAIDPTPYETQQSGRYQLAMDLIDESNPLTSRVAVNRIWHYLFGTGLVRTVDNFGKLGEQPSHPELLDHLALRFQQKGWSVKQMIKEILLSKTWRQSSTPSPLAKQIDPENRFLSHANMRRLTAEEIRDSLLAVSGKLDLELYGPPVGNSTSQVRRSIYLRLARNALNPFLETFDAPVPFATKGRRDSTNVPAQSLTMLNDPFVQASAASLAARLSQIADPEQKIEQLFEIVLSRRPTQLELMRSKKFLNELLTHYELQMIERKNLIRQIDDVRASLSELHSTAQKRLLQLDKGRQIQTIPVAPPLAEWLFEEGPRDSIGTLNGELKGSAKIEQGALILDGKGFFVTAPVKTALKEKSFEVLVQVANLEQRGGGVITVQDLQGNVFDSLVFGEQEPRRWLAGSNNFKRTQSFQASDENANPQTPIHLVLKYEKDGTISVFRNGAPYGKPYRAKELVEFNAGEAQILIGLRHGSPAGNRLFYGRVLEARLYDRALTLQEVAALADQNASIVTEQAIQAAMTPSEQKFVQQKSSELKALEQTLDQFGPMPHKDQAMIDLVHALLNLKEFLYMK